MNSLRARYSLTILFKEKFYTKNKDLNMSSVSVIMHHFENNLYKKKSFILIPAKS
jgi:hypothetical protein